MPVTLAKAKELCTAAEHRIVKSSHPREIIGLTAARLREKIALARKLRDKWRDEARRQRRESRGKQRARGSRAATDNRRTVLKATIFDETLARFTTRLAELEGVIAAPKKQRAKKAAKKKAPGNAAAKSPTKTPAKKSGRKRTAKKAGRKKAPTRGPAKRTDTDAAAAGGFPGHGPLRRAKGRMKVRSESKPARATKHYAESGTKRVSSHMASRTRRNQAKRDSR